MLLVTSDPHLHGLPPTLSKGILLRPLTTIKNFHFLDSFLLKYISGYIQDQEAVGRSGLNWFWVSGQ